MRLLVGILLVVLTLESCNQNPVVEQQIEIESLELVVKESAEKDNVEALLISYQNFMNNYPNDDNTPVYLVRAAELLARTNKPQQATQLMEDGYRKYFSKINTPSNGLFFGNIFREKLQNELLGQLVYKSVLSNFPDSEEVQNKISNSTLTIPNILDDLGNQLYNETTGKIDFSKASNFIEGSVLFAILNPEESIVAEYLYKASETSRAVQNYGRAIYIYEWLISEYTDYAKIGQIHFLYAFTLDNDLGKIDEAKIAYETFIEDFPDSDFVDDAKFLLQNLGKSEEEIIESFNRK